MATIAANFDCWFGWEFTARATFLNSSQKRECPVTNWAHRSFGNSCANWPICFRHCNLFLLQSKILHRRSSPWSSFVLSQLETTDKALQECKFGATVLLANSWLMLAFLLLCALAIRAHSPRCRENTSQTEQDLMFDVNWHLSSYTLKLINTVTQIHNTVVPLLYNFVLN